MGPRAQGLDKLAGARWLVLLLLCRGPATTAPCSGPARAVAAGPGPLCPVQSRVGRLLTASGPGRCGS